MSNEGHSLTLIVLMLSTQVESGVCCSVWILSAGSVSSCLYGGLLFDTFKCAIELWVLLPIFKMLRQRVTFFTYGLKALAAENSF